MTKGEMEATIRKQREEIKALLAAAHPLVNELRKLEAMAPLSARTRLRDLLERWDWDTTRRR